MDDAAPSRPLGLTALAAAYFFFLLMTASSYGYPFPFMGSFYQGTSAQAFVVADSIISLYLFLGILKRQRLTVWLIIGYNLLDVLNACINLVRISPAQYALLVGEPIPEDTLRLNTLASALLLMLLNVYVFRNRRHFFNRSPYLF